MSKNKRISILSIFVSFLFLSIVFMLPTTIAEDEFTIISSDYDVIEGYEPILTNDILPDIIYYRLIIRSDGTKCVILFYYWYEQITTYYVGTHEHDWEPIFIFIDKDGSITGVAYDAWHYQVGRNENMNVKPHEGGQRVFISFEPEYKAIRIENGGVNPIGIDIVPRRFLSIIQETTLDSFGFNVELIRNPFLLNEKGLFGGYKINSFWNSWIRSVLVSFDNKFDFIDFSEDNYITRFFSIFD